MSDFLPIAPQGIGTKHIESLPSIFARATFTHGMGLWPMARLLSHWWHQKGHTDYKLTFSTLYASDGGGLGSYNLSTDLYIRVISAAFNLPDLGRHTMVALRASASRSARGAARGNRAWCPACFHDAVREGTPIYDRLMWLLPPIKRCIEHRIELATECPECTIPQRFMHRRGDIATCWKCDSSLFQGYRDWKPALVPSFGERDCCELVEAIAQGLLDAPPADAFGLFQDELNKLLSPIRFSVDRVARSGGSLRAIGARSLPSLETMLKRTHVAGVSLVAILTSPHDAAAAAGELEFERLSLPTSARPRHARDAVDICRTRMIEETQLGTDHWTPPLPQLADELGVSEGFLRHHLPDLVRTYMRRRLSQAVLKTNQRNAHIQRELETGLMADYQSNRIRSQDELVEILVQRCGAGKAAARFQLNRALTQWRKVHAQTI